MTTQRVQVTKHAERRVRQRIGVPKRSVLSVVQRAYDNGKWYDDANSAVRKWMNYNHATDPHSRVCVYQDYLWIFVGAKLITVRPPPDHLRGKIRKL